VAPGTATATAAAAATTAAEPTATAAAAAWMADHGAGCAIEHRCQTIAHGVQPLRKVCTHAIQPATDPAGTAHLVQARIHAATHAPHRVAHRRARIARTTVIAVTATQVGRVIPAWHRR